MGPYSKDLRERVAAAVDHGEGSHREIARRFRVSLSFVVRLLQRRRDADTLGPKPHGGGPAPALGPDDQQRLAALIREQPDATLEQLRQRGGFTCSLTTLWRALRGLRPDPQEEDPARRRAGPARRPDEAPLVPQEGQADRARTAGFRGRDRGDHGDDPRLRLGPARRAGRRLGPRFVGVGDRDRGDGAGRGPGPAGVPGLDQRGDLPDVRRAGAGAGLHEGDVVVFDNLSAHQAPAVAEAIERAGASVLPLPPYSPDYTPIEEMFSKVKEFLRRVAARAKGDLYDAIGEALREVTPEDIIGWFKEAGLCATHG